MGNYTANIEFNSWASLDLTQTLEYENWRREIINPKDTWNRQGTYTNGSLDQRTSETITKNSQATLNLNKKFGDLEVKSKLSYLYENRSYVYNRMFGSQFVVSGIEAMNNFTNISAGDSYKENERAQNYFAILGLDYKDKLLFDGMFRYDGSSLFGADARWNPYYRVSGAYRISQDVNIQGIDELKVRVAHGTAGIRPNFAWQYEVYNLANGVASATQKGNSLLKPSTTEETEVGLNIDFLKKFNFEAVYAHSNTRNQFLQVPLIPFLNDGFNSQWQNAGVVQSNTPWNLH
jgi:outer membrane receptor protein involved in Fe transport